MFNQRWCDLLGLALNEVENFSNFWKSLVHSDDFTRLNNAIRSHLANDGSALNVDYRMRHGDGRWIWVNTYGRVVAYNIAGRPLRLSCITRDILKRKTLSYVSVSRCSCLTL
ncbi:PAS domain-containing protein [Vreelandella lionensis]|uniref:PAS domain-containing protein n=1 Tax=Vreelandella lionensis TaxID=1144478 RepID=UPI0009F3C40B